MSRVIVSKRIRREKLLAVPMGKFISLKFWSIVDPKWWWCGCLEVLGSATSCTAPVHRHFKGVPMRHHCSGVVS